MDNLLASNRKAYHDYTIITKLEAGIVLTGTEVKSLRENGCSLKECFIRVENGEMYIYGLHIKPYSFGNINNVDTTRVRKLLLHKKEIAKCGVEVAQQGMTIVPLSIYFNDRRIKIEIALAKGKKVHDKRQAEAKQSAARQIQQELKGRR